MTARVCAFLALAALIAFGGCKGEPKAEDIETWIRTGQMAKVREFVANPESKMDLRVLAIQKLVEYGQKTEIQAALQEVPDKKEFVAASLTALQKGLQDESPEIQQASKEALFIYLGVVNPEQREALLKTLAEWAFKGLSAESTLNELDEALKPKGIVGQLSQMGQHGIPVAAWLVSYGANTESLGNYLSKADTPENQRIVILAIQKLFTMKDLQIPWGLLEVSRHFAIPETVDFLIDVYLNEKFPGGARDSALFAAQGLIYGIDVKPGVSVTDTPEKRKVVGQALQRLLATPNATNRWDALELILHAGGMPELDTGIAGLKADVGNYTRFTVDGAEAPDLVIVTMCGGTLAQKAKEVRPILEKWVEKGDAAQKAFSILCLKVLADPASRPALEKVLTLSEEKNASLEYYFFDSNTRRERKPLIADSRLDELTVKLLAQNAIDGIELLNEYKAKKAKGTLSKEEFEARSEAAIGVFMFAGETYRAAVEKKYAARDGEETPDEDTPDEPGEGDGAEEPKDDGEKPKPDDKGTDAKDTKAGESKGEAKAKAKGK